MIPEWSAAIERAGLRIGQREFRAVGVISPLARAGVTTFCEGLSEQRANSGYATLLINVASDSGAPAQRDVSQDGLFSGEIITDVRGFDRLVLPHDAVALRRFSNIRETREALVRHMSSYHLIVLDLPQLADSASHPLSLCAACDSVLLVLPIGISKRLIGATVSLLRQDSINMGAIIWNDVEGASSTSQFSSYIKRWTPSRFQRRSQLYHPGDVSFLGQS